MTLVQNVSCLQPAHTYGHCVFALSQDLLLPVMQKRSMIAELDRLTP